MAVILVPRIMRGQWNKGQEVKNRRKNQNSKTIPKKFLNSMRVHFRLQFAILTSRLRIRASQSYPCYKNPEKVFHDNSKSFAQNWLKLLQSSSEPKSTPWTNFHKILIDEVENLKKWHDMSWKKLKMQKAQKCSFKRQNGKGWKTIKVKWQKDKTVNSISERRQKRQVKTNVSQNCKKWKAKSQKG